MPQDFDFRINGKSELIKSGRLLTTFNTPADGFTAQTIVDPINQPDLFAAVQPYAAPLVEIYIEKELKLTGAITNPRPVKSSNQTVYDLEGFAATYNFIDSELAPPYEFNGQTLLELTEAVAGQTATQVILADPVTQKQSLQAPSADLIDSKFDRATIEPGQTGSQFIIPLADQRNRVISSTPRGVLIIQQADTNTEPVGIIEEGVSAFAQNYGAGFDLRQRFKTFKIKMNTPGGAVEAVAVDDNIAQPRHKIITVSEQVAGGVQSTAEWVKNKFSVRPLTFKFSVIGWRPALNKPLWTPGTQVVLKSKTMNIPDGFVFFINAVEYIQGRDSKTAVLDLIPPNVYTNNPIIEPWFARF